MLQLQSKNPNKKPTWLVEPEYTVGTDPQCGIVLQDTNVKACHAKLSVEDLQARVINLVGDNNVRVNGVPVVESRTIQPGDVLSFGVTELELVDTRTNKPAPAVKSMKDRSRPWVLKPTGAALAGREFTITKTTLVGRAKDCDIALGIAHLSRKHARLDITDRGLQVEDLNSANGTYVNGQKIERAMLKPGDQVRFDSINFFVAGPHQDTDLTTVRPVLHVASAHSEQPQPAPVVKRPPKPVQPPMTSKFAASGLPYQEGVTASGATLIAPKPYKHYGIWLIVAVALSAVAWYLLH